MKPIKIFACFPVLLLSLFSCEKPERPKTPDPGTDQELITTLKLSFADTTDTTIFQFRDPDGPGGNPAVTDTIVLDSGDGYYVNIQALNESVSPAIDITNEILEEAEDHLFCYFVSGADLAINRSDTDGEHPIGIETYWNAGTRGTGAVTIILKHQPGLKDGTCAPGEVDIEVVFPVIVK